MSFPGLKPFCGAAMLALIAPPAFAQDGVSISGDAMAYAVPDYGSVALTQSILESMIDGEQGRAASARNNSGATARDWSVRYDSRISDNVRREYLSNVRRVIGDEGAQAIERHLAAVPVSKQFDDFARQYGLSRSSLADVTTAYVALMWGMANNEALPGATQIKGLKRQILASQVTDMTVPASVIDRQKIAESLQYRISQFLTQRAIAARQGNTDMKNAVSETAWRTVMQSHNIDLRRLRLTDNGLE